MEPFDYRKFITIEPGKRSGKPCIRGMRITVYDVLEYLAGGMTPEEVLTDFPDLTPDDIRACLAFAADQRESPLSSAPTTAAPPSVVPFDRTPTISELARLQGIDPARTVDDLFGRGAGLWETDAEFDAFVELLRADRREPRPSAA